MTGSDPDKAAIAAFELGVFYKEQPESASDAEECFRFAAQSAQPAIAAAALVNLAGLAVQRADLREAETLYGKVLALSDAATEAMSAYGLGTVLTRQPGREREAEAALGRAAASADQEYAPLARYDLGVFLSAQPGRLGDAFAAFHLSADSGHPEFAPRSFFNLGALLGPAGFPDEAERAFRQAIATGHADIAPMAAVNLAGLFENLAGRAPEAEEVYSLAIASGHKDQAPMAAANLGNLLAAQPARFADAEAAYRVAMASGHPLHAPRAAYNLGVTLLADPARRSDAEAAFRAAVESGDAQHAPLALYNLGRLLAEDPARRAEGRTMLEKATASSDTTVATAAVKLLDSLDEMESVEYLKPALGAGWRCVSAATQGAFHLQEYLPEGQSTDDWSEIVSVKRLEAGANLTPQVYLDAIRRDIESRIIDGKLSWETVSDAGNEVIYESALEDDVASQNQSELVRIVREPSALHTVQHAVRGENVHLHNDRDARLALLLSSTLGRQPLPKPESPAVPDREGITAIFQKIGQLPPDAHSERESLCRSGLAILPKAADAERWSNFQLLLGLTLLDDPAHKEVGTDEALIALRKALEYFALEQNPLQWAKALRAVGLIHLDRAGRLPSTDASAVQLALRHAMAAFDKARTAYTPGSVDWAVATLDLADAQLSVDTSTAAETYSDLLAAVENMPPFTPAEYEGPERDVISNVVVRAFRGVQQIDFLQHGRPILPEELRGQPKRGKVLYLRPLLSAGFLKLKNRRAAAAFAVQFEHEPKELTIEMLLYMVFARELNFQSLGGRPDGYGATRFIMARGGTDWKETVRMLAESSDLILVVPHKSEGVSWEMTFLIETGRIDRTLFVMPPLSIDTDVAEMWRNATEMMAGHGLQLPAYRPDGLVFRLAPNRPVVEEWPFESLWNNTLLRALGHLLPKSRS